MYPLKNNLLDFGDGTFFNVSPKITSSTVFPGHFLIQKIHLLFSHSFIKSKMTWPAGYESF